MRVSTSQIYNIANISMKQAQNAIVKTQEQMATNKRILTPADDPVAAPSDAMRAAGVSLGQADIKREGDGVGIVHYQKNECT